MAAKSQAFIISWPANYLTKLSSSSSPMMKHLRATNASPFEYLPISQGPSNSPSPPMLLRLLHDRALPSDEIFFAITQLVCKVPSTALKAFLPGLPVHYFKLDASSIRKLTAAMYLMPSPPATPVEPSPSWGTALLGYEKTGFYDFVKEPAPAYLPVAHVSERTPAYSLGRSGSLMSRVRAAVSGMHAIYDLSVCL